ncbi:hypothetical protein JXR93_12085 [bacterium]|nr:hypothetical protein [bacterium]
MQKETFQLINEASQLLDQFIEDIVLLERKIIEQKNDNDVEYFVAIALLLDSETRKSIVNYANRFKIQADIFEKFEEFHESVEKKDYKALFYTTQTVSQKHSKILDNLRIKRVVVVSDAPVEETPVEGTWSGYFQMKTPPTNPSLHSIELIRKGNLSEYLRIMKRLKDDAVKASKTRYYLEIIKQNHKEHFLKYIEIKKEILKIKQQLKNGF